MDREAWHAAVHGVAKIRTWLSNWTELNLWLLTNAFVWNSLFSVLWEGITRMGCALVITVFSGEAGYRQSAQVIDVFHNLCLSKFPSFFTYKVFSIPVHIPWTLFQATASTSLLIWSFYSRQNGLEWPLHHMKGQKVTKREKKWTRKLNQLWGEMS